MIKLILRNIIYAPIIQNLINIVKQIINRGNILLKGLEKDIYLILNNKIVNYNKIKDKLYQLKIYK